MKIAICAMSVSRVSGGLFTSVRRLSQELANLNHDLTVIAGRDHFTEQDHPKWYPLNLKLVRKFRPLWFGYMPSYFKELERLQPDVVNIHGVWSFHAMAVLKYVRKNPRSLLVISPRGMLDEYSLNRSKLKKAVAWHLYVKHLLNSATLIHVLNERELNQVQKLGVAKERIFIAPNGIDLPVNQTAPVDLQSNVVFGYIGRLHEKKGIDTLISAFKICLGAFPQTTLRIAGPGEANYVRYLERLVERHGMADRVTFIGPVYGEEKEEFFQSIHCFVLPTKSEGLPMTILESWVRGKIVVSTIDSNLNEFGNKKFAILTEAGVKPLAKTLNWVVQNAGVETLAVARQEAVAHAQEHYCWPMIAQKFSRALQAVTLKK